MRSRGRSSTPTTHKTGPSSFSRNICLPLCRLEETPFSLCQGRELLSISSSFSIHQKELTIKKDGALPNFKPSQEKSDSPFGLQRAKRSPLPHPLKQAENSIQVTLGKRRQLLSRRELFFSWQVFTLILRRLDCPSVSAESYED